MGEKKDYLITYTCDRCGRTIEFWGSELPNSNLVKSWIDIQEQGSSIGESRGKGKIQWKVCSLKCAIKLLESWQTE